MAFNRFGSCEQLYEYESLLLPNSNIAYTTLAKSPQTTDILCGYDARAWCTYAAVVMYGHLSAEQPGEVGDLLGKSMTRNAEPGT